MNYCIYPYTNTIKYNYFFYCGRNLQGQKCPGSIDIPNSESVLCGQILCHSPRCFPTWISHFWIWSLPPGPKGNQDSKFSPVFHKKRLRFGNKTISLHFPARETSGRGAPTFEESLLYLPSILPEIFPSYLQVIGMRAGMLEQHS